MSEATYFSAYVLYLDRKEIKKIIQYKLTDLL